MEKMYELLLALHNEKEMSQRKLAKRVHLSLGTTNTLLNYLKQQGFILITKENKKYRYELTQKGKEKLKLLLQQMKQTRLEIKDTNRIIKEAVILAAGKPADFDCPTALLPFEEGKTTPLCRTIEKLLARGIERITVVVGYKRKLFYDKIHYPQVHFVENLEFRFTGTMASLSKLFPIIKEDFLLIEGDLIYEEYLLDQLLNEPAVNAITCVNLSGSTDEAFVDFDEKGKLIRISKDIRQMNRLFCEMMGISKISKELFQEMEKLYQKNNNQWLNYEYLILQASQTYDVKCLFSQNVVWGDIDTLQSYERIKKNTFPIIKRYEDQRLLDEATEKLSTLLTLPKEDIKHLHFAGGMTNSNYAADIKEQEYFIRIPGKGTQKMIDRKNEAFNAQLGSALGLNADTLYINADTGIKITKAIPQAETLSKRSARFYPTLNEVAHMLHHLHHAQIEFPNVFSFEEEWKKYEDIVDQLGGEYYPQYKKVKAQVNQMTTLLKETYGIEKKPCHNDLVAENFIRNGKTKRLYLLDWEYSGMNDPCFDLAAFIIENELTKEEQEYFLHCYYGKKPTKEQKQKVKMFEVYCDMLWSVWTMIKEHSGVSFGTYGLDRFTRCQKQVEEILHSEQ